MQGCPSPSWRLELVGRMGDSMGGLQEGEGRLRVPSTASLNQVRRTETLVCSRSLIMSYPGQGPLKEQE